MIPLVVVLGPTGSGKSALAISIANAVGGEIVNCDSLQVYRGFDVGTAKVPIAERQGIPHHLIDIVEPTDVFTAGDYARAATAVLREISQRDRTAVLVGGTGFYLRGLLEGLSPGPSRDDPLRARLEAREQRRPGSMHRILARLDPRSAARIHPNDRNKTMRALEVRLLNGTPLSRMFENERVPLAGFRPIKIGLDPPREALYTRLNQRARRMFEPEILDRDLIGEVRDLLSTGVPHTAKPFESLGYKQALRVVQELMTVEQALESTQLETRRYAKRQQTWFRKEQGVHWIQNFGDDLQAQAEALTIIERAIAH